MRPVPVLVLVLALVVGCTRAPRWQVLRLPDDVLIAAALDEMEGRTDVRAGERGLEVPAIPAPKNLRPCCAFGTGLQVAVGAVPLPGLALANVVGPSDVGRHRYDGGTFAFGGSGGEGTSFVEHNALVYTCRAGFVDTAHLRDYADWTLFLSFAAFRALRTGAVIELPPEGGARRVRLEPVPPAVIARHGAMPLAIALAEWVAWNLSLWHEIASWYGAAAVSMFPEKASSFSPEDAYSNLLGIKLAAGILEVRGASTDQIYERNMNAWVPRALERVVAVPASLGQAAMKSVDGTWWDSTKILPDNQLVRRRNLELGPHLTPWRVPLDGATGEAGTALRRACTGAPALVLRTPDSLAGTKLAGLVTLEIDVTAEIATRFPFPNPSSHRVTQADFPALVTAIRADMRAELGADSTTRPLVQRDEP